MKNFNYIVKVIELYREHRVSAASTVQLTIAVIAFPQVYQFVPLSIIHQPMLFPPHVNFPCLSK